jgi:hypothetical protein
MHLYDFVRAIKPKKTLEIGMAYGISSLFICQAHRDNGGGYHTAIDPDEEDRFKSIGLLNIERAKLEDLFHFFKARSDDLLPKLYAQDKRFDFAFIDGLHLFDFVLVDFFYIDKLLSIGGHVAFDDLWMPGVRKAVSFILKNTPYRLIPPPSRRITPIWKTLKIIGERFIRNPLGRDWMIKLIPQNIAFLKKMAADKRDWQFYRPF